ncbi:hypothetical protein ACWEPC_56025 [Nonomuraea sp. NPDC004297]
MSLTHKGVNYDVGTNHLPGGALSRGAWRPDLMRQEIRAIRDDLHADSVAVHGNDLDRLVQTATAALEDGLHVWLQPRLVDAGPCETLDHLARAAEALELLRKEYGEIDLNVGCELSVFSAGVIPGASHRSRYVRNLRRQHRHGKPVVVVEFGCGGYQGAAEKGPSSHEIIDRGGPVPVIEGRWVRDERVQAGLLAEFIGVFEWEPKAAFHEVARLYGGRGRPGPG